MLALGEKAMVGVPSTFRKRSSEGRTKTSRYPTDASAVTRGVHGAGESDLVLRNKNTGAFEVYDIANNQLTGAAPLGAVGLDWQLGGFAVDPPTGSMGSSDSSTSQLVQAMASFDGSSGAANDLNTGAPSADTSQQTLLTAPQHA
jgi:hypothetical protein